MAADAVTYGETTVEQLMPVERLQKIRASLPKVAYPLLQATLESAETFWYDHDVIEPSYQDSLGAQTNTKWPDLVAPGVGSKAINGMHDRGKKRWQFPFGTTAGTDNASGFEVVNFVRLPHVDGKPLSIPIWEIRRNDDRPQWMWVYPNGTMFGEVIFVSSGDALLPSEIRLRTRHPDGWSTNVFRPFPRAENLASEIKRRRADWAQRPNLKRMVDHLETPSTLVAKTLVGRDAFKAVFDQAGYLDVLPDFEDPALVRELLTSTTFVSAYETAWKTSGGNTAFAASTASAGLSIVPRNYEAGVIAVNETSCTRCHKETGRLASEFYSGLYLYGELWGKDGIFSLHPFDETLYPRLRLDGAGDNRRINPRFSAMGVFERYSEAKHVEPQYPRRPTVP